MRLSRALQWGIYDRLLAVGSLALGLALALGAIWVGTGDWIVTFATGDLGARPSGDGIAITAIGLLAGLFVWQVGATAARYRTLVGATRRELAGVSADASGDLEERIGQLESDVEEVRRVAARIEQGMRTGEFDAAGLDGDSSAGSGRAAGEAAASSSGGDAAGSATGGAGARSPSGSAAVATGGAGAAAADDADASTDGGSGGAAAGESGGTAAGGTDGVQFSGDGSQSTAATDGAASGAGDGQDTASSTDGGTTADAATATDAGAGAGAGDGATADGTAADGAAAKEGEDEFEWPEEDDDGEYYRNS